ncbi:MAG TPA: DUF1489 domain-containing protein [Stellaceae bacterium]|jgi:hypothetical protein
MPLHLIKLAVGIDDFEHLRRVRMARIAERGGDWVFTRNRPRRAAEVLAGGSVYWVIRGQIRARQRIIGFRSERDETGRRYCLIEVDGTLVPTLARSCRPFQGWRYLPPDAAPADVSSSGASPPERMLAELRALGLI